MSSEQALHSWEFWSYNGSNGDPRVPFDGQLVDYSADNFPGPFHVEHEFGTTLNTAPAKGVVEANASGVTYLLSAQAPLGDLEQGDDIGGAAQFYQVQSFRKESPDATLSATVSDLYLYVADGNPHDPTASQCGSFNLAGDPEVARFHCWTVTWAEARLRLTAWDVTNSFQWRGAGTVALHGWIQNFEHIVSPRESGAAHLLRSGDVQFRELGGGGVPGLAAEVTLAGPRHIQIPLNSVPLHGEFFLATDARVVAYNRRQGESVVSAYFKDPQSTGGGIELTYSGLELLTPTTDVLPVFPDPPPPVCNGGTNAAAGSVQFGQAGINVSESGIAARVPITRTGGDDGELLVRFRTSGGTASATDYTAQDISVYFDDDDAQTHDVFIPLRDNTVEESSRTVNLSLEDMRGCGMIGAPNNIAMTIHDDDAPPPPPPPVYTVGGEVTGLIGTGLVLHDFEGVDEIITANGPYVFDDARRPGTNYDIRVAQQPGNPLQQCSVVNGTGTVADSNVTNVNVSCVNTPDSFGVDPTFGAAGRVVGANPGSAVALQADGKIVVASRLFGAAKLTRYLTNGALDTSFGTGGYVDVPLGGGTNDALNKLIVQPDGRILASGIHFNDARSDDFVVFRFNADGSPDSTFGANGKVLTDFGINNQDRARDMLLQPDGRIVLAGTEAHATGGAYAEVNFGAVRYNADGTLDAGFGTGGLAVIGLANHAINGYAAVLQSDGAIVIAGQARPNTGSYQDTAIARLLPNGAVDTAYGMSGIRRVNLSSGNDDYATDAVLMPDGKVVLSLFHGPNGTRDFTLARFTSTGELDASFNGTGLRSSSLGAANDVARHLALDASGKIIAAGDSADTIYQNGGDFAIARFNADGSLDSTFGYNGAIKVDFYGADDSVDGGIALQPDGNIVAVGVAVSGTVPQFGMVRVLPAGRTNGPS